MYGSVATILSYALPHLALATLTNSRIQGKHRHSFWNEVYETVLAPFILLPTVAALINPKWGKFNVTSKSVTSESGLPRLACGLAVRAPVGAQHGECRRHQQSV